MASSVLVPAELALRAIQKYDEVAGSALDARFRYLLIEAESELGALLGLACTGEPSSWTREGVVLAYDHDGETCPVHEWLVPADQVEITAAVAKEGTSATTFLRAPCASASAASRSK